MRKYKKFIVFLLLIFVMTAGSFDVYAASEKSVDIFEVKDENGGNDTSRREEGIKVNAVDPSTGKIIKGTVFEIYEEKGNRLIATIKGDELVPTEEFKEGTYRLEQIKTLDGYIKSPACKFEIKRGMGVKKLDVVNEIIRAEISYKELWTGDYMSGAVIEIYDSEGKLAASWISDSKPYSLKGVGAGTYLIKTKSVPEGVIPGADKEIVILEKSSVQSFELNCEVKVLTAGIYAKGSNSPVNGGNISIYKIPQGVLSYSTSRKVNGLRGYVIENNSYKKKEISDWKNLSNHITNVKAKGAEKRDSIETDISIEYYIAADYLEKGRTFTQVLPEGVVPVKEVLGKKCKVEHKGAKAFEYKILKKSDSFLLNVELSEKYAGENENRGCSLGITFDAQLDNSLQSAGGVTSVRFKEGVFLHIKPNALKKVQPNQMSEKQITAVINKVEPAKVLNGIKGTAKTSGLESGWYIAVLEKIPSGYLSEADTKMFYVDETLREVMVDMYLTKRKEESKAEPSGEPPKENVKVTPPDKQTEETKAPVKQENKPVNKTPSPESGKTDLPVTESVGPSVTEGIPSEDDQDNKDQEKPLETMVPEETVMETPEPTKEAGSITETPEEKITEAVSAEPTKGDDETGQDKEKDKGAGLSKRDAVYKTAIGLVALLAGLAYGAAGIYLLITKKDS